MAHLTLNIDEGLLRAAKVHAAQHGTSISKIVRDHLAEVTGLKQIDASNDPLVVFARGSIGRREAMRMLDVDYATLIGLLAERGLSLPTLPQDELDGMAAGMNRILDEAGQ